MEDNIGRFKTLYAYIDESGSIVNANNATKRTESFVIAIIITDNPVFVKKVFKRERLKAIKTETYLKEELAKNKELKGSLVPEIIKYRIYEKISNKCVGNFEYGIIRLNNKKSYDYFKANKARVFNFLLKLFLSHRFRNLTRFKEFDKFEICIDERNVATKSLNTLEEFLETSINLNGSLFPKGISVSYCDSKSQLLVQLADFVANTSYRYFFDPEDTNYKNSFSLIKKDCIGNKEYTFPYK